MARTDAPSTAAVEAVETARAPGMQSILGALLTAGYSAAVASAIAAAPNGNQINDKTEAQLEQSFAGAENIAKLAPQYAKQILAGAKSSFVDGADGAYVAGIIAILLGAALVFFFYPKKGGEQRLLAEYQEEDTAPLSSPAR